jgi:hypothetical protein
MALFFLIAFVATFLLSRAALWLMRRWDGGLLRLLAAHLASLALCWGWFAFGSADGKIYVEGGWLFVLPQGLWLILDLGMGKADRERIDRS